MTAKANHDSALIEQKAQLVGKMLEGAKSLDGDTAERLRECIDSTLSEMKPLQRLAVLQKAADMKKAGLGFDLQIDMVDPDSADPRNAVHFALGTGKHVTEDGHGTTMKLAGDTQEVNGQGSQESVWIDPKTGLGVVNIQASDGTSRLQTTQSVDPDHRLEYIHWLDKSHLRKPDEYYTYKVYKKELE